MTKRSLSIANTSNTIIMAKTTMKSHNRTLKTTTKQTDHSDMGTRHPQTAQTKNNSPTKLGKIAKLLQNARH